MFELTMHFKHEMIGIWQRFDRTWNQVELRINRARPVQNQKHKVVLFSWGIFLKLHLRKFPIQHLKSTPTGSFDKLINLKASL